MSSTRHASPDAPIAHERYMSAPEFSDQLGLQGSAVAKKAALYSEGPVRSLLFFIQALSLRPGGISENVAAPLLAMFPERLGTSSMHKFGVKPGTIYTREQVCAVRAEVDGPATIWEGRLARRAAKAAESEAESAARKERSEAALMAASHMTDDLKRGVHYRPQGDPKPPAQPAATPTPAAVFVEACRARVAGCLKDFLHELCLNPTWKIVLPGNPPPAEFCTVAKLLHFHDIVGALLEFQARYAKAAQAAFVSTTVSTVVHGTLDRGLWNIGLVVCNGVEGVGKSFSGEAWCEQHLGEARFIRLLGNQTKTTFYSALCMALGLGSPVGHKVNELQSKVDQFLKQTGMMLVIDEGHRLLPQSVRISAQPELMNWVYGLCDMKCPCALLVTPQFLSRMDAVERQTDWASGQIKRRIKPWTDLPGSLTESDLRAVAPVMARTRSRGRLVLSGPMLDELVDFAFRARHQLDSMARAIEEAAFIAKESGRATATYSDLLTAMKLARETERAMTTSLDRERQAKGAGAGSGAGSRQRRGRVSAAPLQPVCDDQAGGAETRAQDDLTATEYPSREVTPRRSVTVPA